MLLVDFSIIFEDDAVCLKLLKGVGESLVELDDTVYVNLS